MRPVRLSPRTTVVHTADVMTINQEAMGKGEDQSIVLTAESALKLLPILQRFLQSFIVRTKASGPGEPEARQGRKRPSEGRVKK